MTSTARTHGLLAAAAVLYAAALSIVLFWPVHVDGEGGLISFDRLLDWLGRLGMSPEVRYPLVESVANGVLFLPFGVLVAVAAERWRPAARVRTAGLLALGFSIAAETVQWLLVPDRTVDARDVVANTAGAVVGALATVLVLRARPISSER